MSEETESEQISKIIQQKEEEFGSQNHGYNMQSFKQKPKQEMELYEKIIREQLLIERQDYKTYKLNLANICQAVSIVLATFMSINLLLFLYCTYSEDPYPIWKEMLSWFMFGQSGFLILFSGLAIPRSTFTVKQKRIHRREDIRISGLKFAFIHSLTYFISGICMAVLSYFAYLVLHA